jgi:hypothetical protein
MKYRNQIRRWPVTLSVLALAGGLLLGAAPAARAGDDGDGDRGRGRGAFVSPLEGLRTAFYTDRISYLPGRPVLLETRLINFAKRVTFANLQEYDIVVREEQSGRVVWQYSWQFHRRNVLPPHTTFSLGRWETRFNRLSWNQTDNNGRPVPPGVYLIEARIYPYTQVTRILIREDRPDRR